MKEIAGVCSNTFKILIVDDIPLNLLLLDKMLKPFEFQLVKASNGREALHAIQERLGTPEEIDLACCHGAALQHYHRRINKENTGR